MKRVLIATALTLMSASGVVAADDRWEARREYEEARREAWQEQREAQREYDKARREYERDRRKAEREYRRDLAKAEREYEKEQRKALRERERAYRRWARGEYIPRDYLREPYYMRDYRAYELAPPPRGYMWVRPDERDDTYYLVQLATGLISQILGR